MKNKILALLVCAVALVLSSCDQESKVKDFCTEFVAAVNSDDKAVLAKMYPDVAKADSLAHGLNPDSIAVRHEEGASRYLITFGGGKEAVVEVAENGEMKVVSSKGLFAYPEATMALAMKTGWFNPSLTDKDNAEALADTLFPAYIDGLMAEASKGILKVIANGYLDAVDWFESDRWTGRLSVKNTSAKPIPGSAYSVTVVMKRGYRAGALYPIEYGKYKTDVLQGKDIPAGGTVSFALSGTHDWTGGTGCGGIVYDAKLNLNTDDSSLRDLYTFTGKEYADYLAKKQAGK